MGIGSVSLDENVLPEDYLELSKGNVVRNLKELVDALKKMKTEVFRLHVTRSTNDFAEWILEGYNDERLAKKILKTTDKSKIIRLLESAIRNIKPEKKDMKIHEPVSKKSALRKLEGVYDM